MKKIKNHCGRGQERVRPRFHAFATATLAIVAGIVSACNAPLAISPETVTVVASQRVTFTASGGSTPYKFSITTGEGGIDSASGIFIAPESAGNSTVRVTDSTGATQDAQVTINDPLSVVPATDTIAAGTELKLATQGGVPPVSFTLVSGGGSLTAAGDFIAPDAVGTVVIRATDSTAEASEATITVEDGTMTELLYSSNPASYPIGSAITPNAPRAVGGIPTAFSVSPALPLGLTLDPVKGAITGTPTQITPQDSYVVTATNAQGAASATVVITVTEELPANLKYTLSPAVYIKGTAITPNAPSNTGSAITAYGVAPALPAGLSLNATTGVISGTPTTVAAAAAYTVTGSNTAGSTTDELTIAVNDVAPSGLKYATNPANYPLGTTISPNNPTVQGGTVVGYAISPPLPEGLTLSPTTGVLSGTPLAVTETTNYRVTATNSGGSTSVTLSITVPNVAPTHLTYSTSPATYSVGKSISENRPENGGGGITAYSVSPALPPGLSLDPKTGVIAGKPAAVSPATPYVVTGSNAIGSTETSLTITVVETAPTDLSYSQAHASYRVGQAIAPNSPRHDGGDVTAYSVSPPLPTGLSLDPSTGVISGTPIATFKSAHYRVTASNSLGATSADLTITVTK